MNNSLNNMKNNNLKDGSLLNAGLSLSSQSLNETNEFNGISEEGIPRSESLPDMSSCENSETWQASRTKKVCISTLYFYLLIIEVANVLMRFNQPLKHYYLENHFKSGEQETVLT